MKRLHRTGIVLDVLLVLSVLLLLFGFPAFFFSLLQDEGDLQSVEYTLLFSDAEVDAERAFTVIPVGSAVYSANGTALLGYVSEVRIHPHRTPVLQDGRIVFVDVPQKWDIRVTVCAEGRSTPKEGVRVSEIRISAGGQGDFCAGGYFGSALILYVGEAKE